MEFHSLSDKVLKSEPKPKIMARETALGNLSGKHCVGNRCSTGQWFPSGHDAYTKRGN
jgi:hypothetical protein